MARQKVKQLPPRTAVERRRTETVHIEGAYGGTDKVERLADTAFSMFRRGQIDADQKAAADRFVWAHETCADRLPCALGMDAINHQSGSRTPFPSALRAAEALHQARQLLGELDHHLLRLILIEGLTIEAVGRRLYRTVTQRDANYIGRRFRGSLNQLAALWMGRPRQRMRSYRPADATPHQVEAGMIMSGGTAHAGGYRGVTRG